MTIGTGVGIGVGTGVGIGVKIGVGCAVENGVGATSGFTKIACIGGALARRGSIRGVIFWAMRRSTRFLGRGLGALLASRFCDTKDTSSSDSEAGGAGEYFNSALTNAPCNTSEETKKNRVFLRRTAIEDTLMCQFK